MPTGPPSARSSERVTIPVVVNGDIRSLRRCRTGAYESGADGVMVGAEHRPAVVSGAGSSVILQPAAARRAPSLADQFAMIDALYDEMLAHYGARDRPPPRPQASGLGARCRRRDRRCARLGCLKHHRARSHRRTTASNARAFGERLRCFRMSSGRMSRAQPLQRHREFAGRRGAQCLAASRHHGVGRRQNRRCQCGRRAILRSIDPDAAPLHVARPGAVRLACCSRWSSRSARNGSAVNEYKVDLATPRNPGERLVDLHVVRCRNFPTTSLSCCKSAPLPTRWIGS